MNQVQNELAHYGVLGMKWGKRMATSAAKGLQKDVDSLRSHGYRDEANAIEKMADRKRAKAKELDGKIKAKEQDNQIKKEATKKAKGDAWRNTGIFVAGYGAVTLAALYAQNR